jgi:hypothetical protein
MRTVLTGFDAVVKERYIGPTMFRLICRDLAAIAISLVAATSCGRGDGEPEARFVVELSVSDTRITAGEAGVITFRFRNGDSVQHTVNVGCAFYAYIRAANGTTIHPSGGTYDCPNYALEFWNLAPGADITRTIHFVGPSSPPSPYPAILLETGRYIVHAEFTGTVEGEPGVGPLRSSDVSFEIRE